MQNSRSAQHSGNESASVSVCPQQPPILEPKTGRALVFSVRVGLYRVEDRELTTVRENGRRERRQNIHQF